MSNIKKNQEVEDALESFNIVSSDSLIEDINKMDMKMKNLPDIEVKEVVIQGAGNFLNLQGNIINIPVEMIVFPFFTPQKQNKRINFQYSFEDLGVTMYCTLVAKDNNDMVYQPSMFEEKIYNFLICMYEGKKDSPTEEGEYIEFEISDFIVNFLGNKMNRVYYTKVEQALKNLKSTEYQFVVSNHTKFGKYRFEDEEFKLLTYQKLKKGKKVFYRVLLNKNIRQKIKDKRYIKYNSKALMEIITKDPIAGRIYKYISKVRYEETDGRINLRTLAAIIPLRMEQETERITKTGETKIYVLNRAKQVLKRVLKAFDILVELGYILEYSYDESKKEDTYYINYTFNVEKDGECHISTFIESNKTKMITNKNKNTSSKSDKIKSKSLENLDIDDIEYNPEDIQEAEIIEIKDKPKKEKAKPKSDPYKDLPISLVELIHKAKRNIYASRAWDKRTDTKIRKIYNEDGEELAAEVLKIIYKNLNKNVRTTLVQYINGILKNIDKGEFTEKQNLTLFNNEVKEKTIISKKKIKQARKSIKKSVISDINTLKEDVDIPNDIKDIIKEFEKLDDYEKLKVEEEAIKLCSNETGTDENFLLLMKNTSKLIYLNTIKKYIGQILERK
ncbi:chromosomal replication initiator DnaA [Fusobacterium sp. FSA-380-WT-3A]|nr:chromosomal replication initiator DnaA [Fusobacterium sp. FSA-380-WT-3A]NME36537.1 chromosomal replication initiator DnaA [Fusobacterium sp. FSA-380-WT-3A]